MYSLHSIKEEYFTTYAIFEVPIENGEPVYMKVNKSNDLNDKRFVVIVDAEKFLNCWALNPNSDQHKFSHGSKETWIRDHKYHKAVEGFSHGIKNPVPLARTVFREHTDKIPVYTKKWFVFNQLSGVDVKKFFYSSFIDGITRTMWLLANGARYFPIECYQRDGFEHLHSLCGYENTEYKSISQLIP